MAKPPAKLLKKNREAFRRAQEHHQVNLWDIDSFTEDIDDKEKSDSTRTEVLNSLVSNFASGLT
jgi:hypothetical protein